MVLFYISAKLLKVILNESRLLLPSASAVSLVWPSCCAVTQPPKGPCTLTTLSTHERMRRKGKQCLSTTLKTAWLWKGATNPQSLRLTLREPLFYSQAISRWQTSLVPADTYSLTWTRVSLSLLPYYLHQHQMHHLPQPNNETKFPTSTVSSPQVKLFENIPTASIAPLFIILITKETLSFQKTPNDVDKSPSTIPISFPEFITTVTPQNTPKPFCQLSIRLNFLFLVIFFLFK